MLSRHIKCLHSSISTQAPKQHRRQAHVYDVLHADQHAMERSPPLFGKLIHPPSLRSNGGGVEPGPRLNLSVAFLDTGEMGLNELFARQRAGAHERDRL